jgi:hypothetical protein
MGVDWQATGTLLAATLALIGMVCQYFVVISSLRKDNTDLATNLRKDITDLATNLRAESVNTTKGISEILEVQGTRLTRMETKMELFWNAIGTSMANLIKQPTHFRKDELMDKLIPKNLPHLPESNIDELVELKLILKDELITLQEIKDPKSIAYSLAIAYIDQILYDKGLFNGECR